MASAEELPFHLRGNYAPVSEEITATDLAVEGSIPRELRGLFVRNGANPVTGRSPHWFVGHGMLHGVRLEEGRAAWYRNRYVRTPYLDHPDRPRVSEEGKFDRIASAANTHIIRHAGKLLALEEGAFPWEVDGELETVGVHDYEGRLETAMTAHPKLCPVTGELHFFGYGQLPPYLVYHRADPDGKLVQSEEITVGGPTMIHDFAITEQHVLFMDLPVVFDLEVALRGQMPFHWSDDYPARIGVMPRGGTNADVQWFEIEPCYVFHPMNAYTEEGRVVMDVSRYSEMWRRAGQFGGASVSLHRFTFDLARGTTREETLDDRPQEFPRVADASVGLPYRYGYSVGSGGGGPGSGGESFLLKHDLATGVSTPLSLGPGRTPGEPVFAPGEGAASGSDEGYLVTYVYDEGLDASEFVVLDAQSFDEKPLARVRLPQRVPFGFHGSWLADA